MSKQGQQHYDLYLFAVGWSPRLCCTASKNCAQQGLQYYDGLSAHGLWPARRDSPSYPSYCKGESKENSSATIKGREKHEWAKHGSCSSYATALEYFKAEASLKFSPAVISLDKILKQNAGGIVFVEDLTSTSAANAPKIAIMANKYCQLEELTLCFAKKQDGTVGEQVDCPKHVMKGPRNSVVAHGCQKIALDTSKGGAGTSCSFISKEMLSKLLTTKKEA